MNVVFLIGHIVVGVYFVFMGFNHFMNLNMLSEYAQSKGVPAAKLAVAVTGLLLLAGGASLLLWQYLFYGMIALTVFLIPVTHIPHFSAAKRGNFGYA